MTSAAKAALAAALALTCLLLAACKDDGSPPLGDSARRDGRADGPRDGAGDGGDGDGLGAPASGIAGFFDVHSHCKLGPACVTSPETCCDIELFQTIADRYGGRGFALLSTEHFAVNGVAGQDMKNEIYAAAAARDARLELWPSLECWHDTPFDDAGWAAACKADVDRWLAAGAVGFKDHIGKQFNQSAQGSDDDGRWLGAFNRKNGFCTVPPSEPEPNLACMRQSTVRYPALEAKWREVLSYITERRGAKVLTHATSWFGSTDRCFDPVAQQLADCVSVGRSALLDLARWAEKSLSAAARGRIIVAHLGFFHGGPSGGMAQLDELLRRGLSVDTAATLTVLRSVPCAVRAVLAAHPDRILFGTDAATSATPSCHEGKYAAWHHFVGGKFGEVKTFRVCGDTWSVSAAALSTPRVDGCPNDLPADMRERFVYGNYLAL